MESKKRKASLIETQNKKGTNGKNKIIKTTKNKNDIFELLKKKIENGETIDVLFEDLVEIEDIRQEEKSFKLRDMKLIHLMKRMETNKFISGGKILREGYFRVGGSFIKSKERASRITEKSKYFKRSYVIKFDQNGKDKIFAVYGVGIITKTGNIQQIDKQRNLCGAEMSLDQFTSEIYKHFMTEEMKEPETKARRCGWKANYLLKSMEDLERWESISDKNTKYQCPFKNWVPLDKCRILGYQLCMSLSNNKINGKFAHTKPYYFIFFSFCIF
jgi:hypothetical protein